MANRNQIITFLFILLNLISYTQSIEINPGDVNWISFHKGKEIVTEVITDSKAKEIRYAVEFLDSKGDQYNGPAYLKIEVTVESGNSPLLCFSHDDSFCETRDILRKNPNYKSVYIWAKRDQYEAPENEPYFTVKCAGNVKSCAYTINVIGNDDQINVEPNFIYSFLASTNTREMDYMVNTTQLTVDQRLVICVEGSPNVQLKLKSDEDEVTDFGNIHCANIKKRVTDLNFGKFSLVRPNKDEYLTLSVHAYTNTEDNLGRADPNFNFINTGILTSYIEGGTTKEECFPLTKELLEKSSNYLYVSGRIHTKYAYFFIETEKGEWIENVDVTIKDGLYAYVFNNTNKTKEFRYLCLEIPEEPDFPQDAIIFSIQIMDYGKLLDVYDYEEPMNQGEIYRHIIPKGRISTFHFAKSIKISDKNDYTLSRIRGKSRLYFGECKTFPNCRYTTEDLPTFNTTYPAKINNDIIYTTKTDRNSALGNKKDVMVVHCEDALGKEYCEFDTSLFTKGQEIILAEEKSFGKFILKEETGVMIVDLQAHRQVSVLIIDLMIFSGDVSFSIKETNIDYKQFYLSNKVVFSITRPSSQFNKVTIAYEANLNSYFTAKYAIDAINAEQLEEKFHSGQSYLVQINPSSQLKQKTVYLNSILNYKVPLMVNFFEINCEFEVKRLFNDTVNITFSDGYAQDYYPPEEDWMDLYGYTVKIKEVDPSNNNNKMCMIYISGVEVDNIKKYEREIAVPQNINQQLIFDDDPKRDFRRVRFTYPIVDIHKEFAVRFNVIDKAHYILNAYINGKILESFYDFHVAVTSMYFFHSLDLTYCEEDKVCSFILDIEMFEKIVPTNPMIEVTFREVLNIPTYLQKGMAKLDYVFGDKLYYLYTDVGRNDVGEITLNFLREFGNLWARIVKKDLKTPETKANWRKVYRLPGPDGGSSLDFDGYTRKLRITTKDTEDCINGCYLLLTIQINDVGEYVPDFVFYYFSILVKITSNKKTYNDIPKVVIQVDEYIIGSLDVTEMDDRLISEFYEVWLPHDSDQVEIDWQSQLASLYINVGGVRPITTRADFSLNLTGTDGVIVLTKEEILDVAKKRGMVLLNDSSIQDVNLVIGVWTNITDSGNHELYSLRVHQHENVAEENEIDIIEITSDQKHVCRPRKIKRGYDIIYRCLFVIKFNADPSIDNPLFVYGFSSDPIGDTYLLADFIDIDTYNTFDKEEMRRLIPTPEKAEYNADRDGVNYLYVETLPTDKVFFVSLYSYLNNDMSLINSIPIYNSIYGEKKIELYPNPFTEQIFACSRDKLTLKFPVQSGIAVTLEVLAGEAEINWRNDDTDKFKVKGAGDRIKLFSQTNELEITNLKPITEKGKNTMADPGFLFFVRYKTRDADFNFDDVPFGKSTELSYRETDLPAVIYSKLINIYKGLNMAITFKENHAEFYGQYLNPPIEVIATVLDQNKIYTMKKQKDKTMKPSDDIAVKGYYDPAIKTALLYLSEEKIESYNIKKSENPHLYVRLDKSMAYKQDVFSFFNIEAEISGINDFVPPVEKVYHYGKFGADQYFIFYPLKITKNKNFLRVQVALNSDQLDFTISKSISSLTNDTFPYMDKKKERGKVIVTFESPKDKDTIYLNFFRKDDDKNDERLSNYAFKYINADMESEFIDYTMKNKNLLVSIENNNTTIKCTFDEVEVNADNYEITYFLKVIENKSLIYGEDMNTIAVTESPSSICYEKNPTATQDKKITITCQDEFSLVLSNYAVINVIAQIRQKNIIEYVAYNKIENIRPSPDGGSTPTTNNTVIFGVVGGVLGAIVIGLVVVIIYFQMKNKSLLNQVKHVSFQKTNTNMDPNLLLQKDKQEESENINPS